ncbi:hypothetical protein ARMGADRAFT_1036711 [Armillaria gallica]|uniref:Uncharacterized protein n=1 Tax=Armillaria gallica TaxID=47427 RepID=A0A2H3CT24_ARMGA|nr:hypothetical protein ARMGADRAFT_1036711 [Armillaria gallica]
MWDIIQLENHDSVTSTIVNERSAPYVHLCEETSSTVKSKNIWSTSGASVLPSIPGNVKPSLIPWQILVPIFLVAKPLYWFSEYIQVYGPFAMGLLLANKSLASAQLADEFFEAVMYHHFIAFHVRCTACPSKIECLQKRIISALYLYLNEAYFSKDSMMHKPHNWHDDSQLFLIITPPAHYYTIVRSQTVVLRNDAYRFGLLWVLGIE